MTAFDETRRLEAKAWTQLQPFIAKYTGGLYAPVIGGGMLAQTVQRSHDVDVIAFRQDRMIGLELKCEFRNKWGNFFLETWSNKAFGRARDGWMMTCSADTLLYYFLEEGQLFVIPFPELWAWAFGDPPNGKQGNLQTGRYPEKPQKRYEQLNATFGFCVPIEDVVREVGCGEWRHGGGGEFACIRDTRKKRAA